MEMSQAIPVSVIVAMRNSETTIVACLEGLIAQEYPIREIIVLDNVSTDGSVGLVEDFARSSPIALRLIRQSVNGGLTTSYNLGAELAASALLVFVHSDSMLPSTNELGRLVGPLLSDSQVVAAYPILMMPQDVWERFPFWQKYLFARVALTEKPSMCGKFDCIRKEAYQRVGRHNTKRFTVSCGYGGEDSDLHARLIKAGKIVGTSARVIHLHDLSGDYGLRSLFGTRKMLARTYGKILVFQGVRPVVEKLPLLFKPMLACFLFAPIPMWGIAGGYLLFSLLHSMRLYASPLTRMNVRILLVPLIDMALIFYETFWFIEGLLTSPADVKRSD